MERIDSCHSIWIFDTDRMRFRRIPKGTDVAAPAMDSDWVPYFGLEISTESGAFAVALNENRTRLLRSWRHTNPCEHCGSPGDVDVTGEVSLLPTEK